MTNIQGGICGSRLIPCFRCVTAVKRNPPSLIRLRYEAMADKEALADG